MSAGVIRFWLCDRDFDCENCPLDAALRGRRGAAAPETPLPRSAHPARLVASEPHPPRR
jgi:hypothetical protein